MKEESAVKGYFLVKDIESLTKKRGDVKNSDVCILCGDPLDMASIEHKVKIYKIKLIDNLIRDKKKQLEDLK
jgi:hypothetical protein